MEYSSIEYSLLGTVARGNSGFSPLTSYVIRFYLKSHSLAVVNLYLSSSIFINDQSSVSRMTHALRSSSRRGISNDRLGNTFAGVSPLISFHVVCSSHIFEPLLLFVPALLARFLHLSLFNATFSRSSPSFIYPLPAVYSAICSSSTCS